MRIRSGAKFDKSALGVGHRDAARNGRAAIGIENGYVNARLRERGLARDVQEFQLADEDVIGWPAGAGDAQRVVAVAERAGGDCPARDHRVLILRQLGDLLAIELDGPLLLQVAMAQA